MVADQVAQFISNIGVQHVFMLPGGGNMYLVDAVGRHPNLTPVCCLHEQACAIAAEAYGRITGNIGVCMVTTGPGGTNAITAVVGAWLESVPLLVISGQVKRSDLKRGEERQRGPQEVDIVTLVSSVTKFATTTMSPWNVKEALAYAVKMAKQGRMGPVWIDIPLDVQCAP